MGIEAGNRSVADIAGRRGKAPSRTIRRQGGFETIVLSRTIVGPCDAARTDHGSCDRIGVRADHRILHRDGSVCGSVVPVLAGYKLRAGTDCTVHGRGYVV